MLAERTRIYGISAWDLILDNTTQTGLIITKTGDPVVTVNDIEVAQFIYFMLNSKKIRRVINSLTSKASISARNAMVFPDIFPFIVAITPVLATCTKGMPKFDNSSFILWDVFFSFQPVSGYM